MQPTKTVDEIIQLIQQYQLMSSKDIATMKARWSRADRKEVADTEKFCHWLVMNHYLTEFVAKVLSGRKSSQLVLNQYRLTDQLISGPMAGAYLAIDALDRHVAIEVLSAESAADKAMLATFQKAAQNAMKVNHLNVGRILDTGEAHGFYFLVKEHYEGQTLEDIFEKRKMLPYQQAARLMALALAGVDALHSAGVSAGDLTADCLLLAPVGKNAPNQRTVKILHAGVKRKLFDETAIGRSIRITAGIPDELELAASCTFQVSDAGAVSVADDIFRLGCVFYRAVTGRLPFHQAIPRNPTEAAKPVCQVNAEIPEMLGQIIDEMIDIKPENRPKKASHVAKALRVFLAADEQGRETKAEEQIALTREPAPEKARAEAVPDVDVEEEEDEEEPESAPATRKQKRTAEAQDGFAGRLAVAWEQIRPENRDLIFLAGGALGILVLILLLQLLVGLRFIYIAGLVTGAAASYFVELFIRWRRTRNETE